MAFISSLLSCKALLMWFWKCWFCKWFEHFSCFVQLFEKVVVLNEMHGQSDAFCVAVKQLGSRWKLVCIALPHLIHCCSIALHCRDRLRGCGSTTRLPPASQCNCNQTNRTIILIHFRSIRTLKFQNICSTKALFLTFIT